MSITEAFYDELINDYIATTGGTPAEAAAAVDAILNVALVADNESDFYQAIESILRVSIAQSELTVDKQ